MHISNARKQCTAAMPIRTDARTYEESWLGTRDLLTFRNARAHMRISALGLVRSRADAETEAAS